MIEKRKLSQYEKIILASAYNLKNYCRTTRCSDCIFLHGDYMCLLTPDGDPFNWEIDKAGEIK